MTDPLILQRLYSSHGPLIDESLKLRLKIYRQRLRLVLTVSINSIVHVLVFFSIALLVRYLDVQGTPADITLSVVAVLIFASMAKTIIPALINHWRSESGIRVVAPVRRFRVHTLSEGPPVNAEFLFYLFMTPETSDALIGDLEEQYKATLVKFGKSRADLWYWTQTIQSLGSIVWWATKRVIGSLSRLIAFGTWRRVAKVRSDKIPSERNVHMSDDAKSWSRDRIREEIEELRRAISENEEAIQAHLEYAERYPDVGFQGRGLETQNYEMKQRIQYLISLL